VSPADLAVMSERKRYDKEPYAKNMYAIIRMLKGKREKLTSDMVNSFEEDVERERKKYCIGGKWVDGEYEGYYLDLQSNVKMLRATVMANFFAGPPRTPCGGFVEES